MGTRPKDFAVEGGTVRAGMKNVGKRVKIKTHYHGGMHVYSFL
jgi:hypothetical protein